MKLIVIFNIQSETRNTFASIHVSIQGKTLNNTGNKAGLILPIAAHALVTNI